MFCPKCGSMLLPGKEKGEVSCSCGYTNKGNLELKEKPKNKKEDVKITTSNDDNLPKTKAECPKCKNEEAYFWMIQTRAGDEPETKFLKCTKCKHTWRDYS